MSIGEPVLVNNNSFDNITKILKEYKTLHNIGNSREWVFLGKATYIYLLTHFGSMFSFY